MPPVALAEDIERLNFGSIQQAGEGFRDLGVVETQVGSAINAALTVSETRGLRLARGILATAADADQATGEATTMVEWAARQGSTERQLVGRALRLSEAGVFAVDRIGTLPRGRARPFMADYLASGGQLREVAEWLDVVGGVLRRHGVKPTGTSGFVVDAAEWVADRAEDAVDAIGEAVDTVVDAVEQAGRAIGEVVAAAATWTAEQVANVVQALTEAGRTVGEILASAVAAGATALRRFVRAVIDAGRAVGDVLAWAAREVAGTLREVVGALRAAGVAILDMVKWAVGVAANAGRALIRAIVDVGIAVVDLIAAVASAGLAAMRVVIDGLFAIGRALHDLLRWAADLALDAVELMIRAAVALGRTVLEIGRTVLSFTYRLAARVIRAAVAAGIGAVELLGAVVGRGYFAMRKMISGILDAAGPVGDVLEWALDRLEQATENVFRDVIVALRYGEARLADALDWAVEQADAVLEAVVQAWEAAGENLIDFYRWARARAEAIGDIVWERIGALTQRVHNSVRYVLVYLEKDFIPGTARFVKGLLEAGYVLADLVVRLAERTATLIAEVVGAVLDLGFTIADLLLATLQAPDRVMDNVIAALRAADRTARSIYSAAVEAGEAAIRDVTLAWRRLQAPLDEMLKGVLEASGGALGTVVSLLLNQLATYRPLSKEEKRAARLVFADSIDLDTVSVSAESLDNEIIFAIQNLFDQSPDSRAFVTTTLINFDVSQGIDTPTLIHELTHVWQALVTGPFYLSEAIHAQVTDPNAYNYGYTSAVDGTDGADDLRAANGNFDGFNREQQGQIAMHYYVRRHELVVTRALETASSDLGGGASFNNRLGDSAPAAGSIPVTVAPGATEDSYGYTRTGVPGIDGLMGPMTVQLSVANGNTAIRASVGIGRVNAAGIEQAASAFAAEAALPAGSGTLRFSLPTVALGQWAAGDRLRIDYRFRNTHAAAPQGFTLTAAAPGCIVTATKDWTPWRPYVDVIQAA